MTEAAYAYEVSVCRPGGGDAWSEPSKLPKYNPNNKDNLNECYLQPILGVPTLFEGQAECTTAARLQSIAKFLSVYAALSMKATDSTSIVSAARGQKMYQIEGAVQQRVGYTEDTVVFGTNAAFHWQNTGTNRTLCPAGLLALSGPPTALKASAQYLAELQTAIASRSAPSRVASL